MFGAKEQNEISLAILETQKNERAQSPETVAAPLCWEERIGEELFLIREQALQHSQIFAINKHMPAIRYIHHSSPNDFQHLLLGLLDAQGECCGLGILKALIFTPVAQEMLKALQFSSYHVEVSSPET